MSVLVKGMKMPKACCECGFNHCSQSRDDDTCLLLDKGISQLFVLVDRLPDCPLVEVPTPHGRLIDEEVLWDTLRYGYDVDLSELPETLAALLEMIDHQDTIIEAEEGEDHEQN